MQKHTTIGIDVGTTSVSTVVLDGESGKNLFASSRYHHADINPDGTGAFLQDPAKILHCVQKDLLQALKNYPQASAIGITGQMHSMLLLDKRGVPASPLFTWMDNRLSWRHEASGKSYRELMYEEHGCAVPKGYAAGTLYVLKMKQRIPSSARALSSLPDYIAAEITGKHSHRISPSMAHSLGLFDTQRNDFSSSFYAIAKDIRLPTPAPHGFCLGPTQEDIPVFLPEGDNQTSFIASVRDPEYAISINLGTSGQISLLAPEARAACSHSLEERPFPNNHSLLVGASLSGGKSFEILSNLISEILDTAACPRIDPYALLNTLAQPRDSSLSISTLFNGSRRDTKERGIISNITFDNFTLAHIYWALARGIIQELLDMLGAHIRILSSTQSYVAISGNALKKNNALSTTLSTRIGCPLKTPLEAESAARGAAILALAGLQKHIPSLATLQQTLIHYVED